MPLSAIAITVLVALWLLPLKSVRGSTRSKLMKVDYPGSVRTIASSISIIVALNWGGVTFPWKSVQVVVPLLMGEAWTSWSVRGVGREVRPSADHAS